MKYVLGSWSSEQLRIVGPNILSFSTWMRKRDWSRALILNAAECSELLESGSCRSSCGQQNVTAVSRALKNDPEVALGIRRIRSLHFRRGLSETAFCQAILDIISQSTLVEAIDLQHIHAALTQELSDALGRSANVQDFSISGGTSRSPLARVKFSDLLGWVGRWKHLRKLTVSTFGSDITL